MDTVRTAAPIFLSVVLGIYLVAAGLTFCVVAATLGMIYALGWLFRHIGKSQIKRNIPLALFVWQLALLMPIAVIAAITYATTYISLEATTWLQALPNSMVDKSWLDPRASDIGKALVGALNTLIAALWLDNAKSPRNSLWPSGQIKKAFDTLYEETLKQWEHERHPLVGMLRRAVQEDKVTEDLSGWSYEATRERWKMIEKLKTGSWP